MTFSPSQLIIWLPKPLVFPRLDFSAQPRNALSDSFGSLVEVSIASVRVRTFGSFFVFLFAWISLGYPTFALGVYFFPRFELLVPFYVLVDLGYEMKGLDFSKLLYYHV